MKQKTQGIPARFQPDWLEKLDGRTAIARAVNTRLCELISELGDTVTYQRASLAKRIVWLECLIEQRETAMARGEPLDETRHIAAVNALSGLYRQIGLDRQARNVPDLRSYIEARS